MARPRNLLIGLALAATAIPADGEPAREPPANKSPFSASEFGKQKEPITVSSDTLEYDYKANVVVYRGDVQAMQGPVKVRSDVLTVTLENAPGKGGSDKGAADKAGTDKPGEDKGGADKAGADKGTADKAGGIEAVGEGTQRLRQILATGRVRIDHGTRWATGGRATFDQGTRTIVLTEEPVLHDGKNEVMGDRVVVYLDEDRSVVEGGRKRVKAVLYPNKGEGLAPQGTPPGREANVATTDVGAGGP
jgi:lipopolysaccharide export system protein LptA